MSRICDIYNSYGNEFNIAVANTWSYNVLNSTYLPSNMMIITSPYNYETGEDIGAHSIILTDNDGIPVRLTYSINANNGFIVENDILKLELDTNNIITDENNNIALNIAKMLDNESLSFDNGTIKASIKLMQKASNNHFGIAKSDNYSIKNENGILSVNTSNIDLASNIASTYGIIKEKQNDPLKISKGVAYIDTNKIQLADNNNFGIGYVDGVTIKSYNGTISASIDNLPICSSSTYGVVKVDSNTIKSENNIIKADFSKVSGLIKVDGITTTVDNNGVLKVASSYGLTEAIINIGNQIDNINIRIDNIETFINEYSPVYNSKIIYAFTCNGLASAMMLKPKKYGELPEDMESQHISAEFTINTNCSFRIYLDYEDNITPQVTLYEINYNDIEIYKGNTGLNHSFQSTNGKNAKLTFSWISKNYRNNDNKEYSKKTKINLEIRAANDASIKKSVKYSILRYNSFYNDTIDTPNDEIIISKYKKSTGKTKSEFNLIYNKEISGIKESDNLRYNYYSENDIEFWPAYFDNDTFIPAKSTYNIGAGQNNYIYFMFTNGVNSKYVAPTEITSDSQLGGTYNNNNTLTITYSF